MRMAAGGAARAHFGMILWALIVGGSFPVLGLLGEGLPPLGLTALRFAIAALAVLPLVRGGAGRPSMPTVLLYLALGLCLAVFFGTMFWAAHRVPALHLAALYVAVPLLAYGLGRALGVERPSRGLVAILALGAAGALALAVAGNGGRLAGFAFGIGEAAYFAGCVAIALYPVLSRWGLDRGWLSPDPAARSFWSLATGAALMAAAALATEPVQALARLAWTDLLVLAYLALLSSAATFWLLQYATGSLGPAAVTAYSYLVAPVSAALLLAGRPQDLGWHWLPGTALSLLAIALLLGRDLLLERDLRARPAPAPLPGGATRQQV